MATKTFEELKQLAIQIRDEKTNKQNTATRVGTAMLEHINKLEQDYYDKNQTDEELKERDDKLTKLSDNINSVNSELDSKFGVDNITLLQGGISSSDGEIVEADNRVHTDYISGNISITLNEEYSFLSLAEYDENFSFKRGESNINNNVYEGNVDGFIRLGIKRNDSGNVNPNENIIKSFRVLKDSQLYKEIQSKQTKTFEKDLSSSVVFLGAGFIKSDGGVDTDASKTEYSDFVDIKGFAGSYINIKFIQLETTFVSQHIAFYNDKKEFISSVHRSIGKEKFVDLTFKVPSDAAYFRTTYWNEEYEELYGAFECYISGIDTGSVFSVIRNKNQEQINQEFEDEINEINQSFEVGKINILVNFLEQGYVASDGNIKTDGTVIDYSDYTDCRGINKIYITVPQLTTIPKQGLAFYDENKVFIKWNPRAQGTENDTVVQEYDVPEKAVYFRTSYWNEENQSLYGYFECYFLGNTVDTSKVHDEQFGKSQKDINKELYGLINNTRSSTLKKLDFREICDYYYINNKGVATESDIYGCSSLIYCRLAKQIKITMPIVLSSDALPYLVFINESGSVVSSIAANIGSERGAEELTLDIPGQAVAFKTSYWNYEQAKTLGVEFSAEFTMTSKYRDISVH